MSACPEFDSFVVEEKLLRALTKRDAPVLSPYTKTTDGEDFIGAFTRTTTLQSGTVYVSKLDIDLWIIRFRDEVYPKFRVPLVAIENLLHYADGLERCGDQAGQLRIEATPNSCIMLGVVAFAAMVTASKKVRDYLRAACATIFYQQEEVTLRQLIAFVLVLHVLDYVGDSEQLNQALYRTEKALGIYRVDTANKSREEDLALRFVDRQLQRFCLDPRLNDGYLITVRYRAWDCSEEDPFGMLGEVWRLQRLLYSQRETKNHHTFTRKKDQLENICQQRARFEDTAQTWLVEVMWQRICLNKVVEYIADSSDYSSDVAEGVRMMVDYCLVPVTRLTLFLRAAFFR